ncbi:hypothetical protein JZ751_027710 [Albula glossodonta]|uniref:Uncharacterized protein n=1 Tax=Albula glossodonta TaxID=121402 RepID=A0A8T2PJZ9_9TELE|nr:hypothetical protein JZ751_027710 [Albula glossodonta]
MAVVRSRVLVASVHQNTAEPLGQKDLQAEESESAQIETGISSLLLDPQNNADTEGEESMNVNVNQERDFFREEQASPPFPAGIDHNIAWINQEAGDQLQVLSQERAKEVEAKEKNPEVLGAVGPEQREVHEAMQEPHTPDEQEGKEARAYPHTPPARMKAVPSTPIFTLNSPGQSPGHYKPSDCKSPAFMFSINTTPETPGFSAFDCAFDTGSPQEEVRNCQS